jgi:hypothetical protein
MIAETASRLFLFMILRGEPREIVRGVHVHLAVGQGMWRPEARRRGVGRDTPAAQGDEGRERRG